MNFADRGKRKAGARAPAFRVWAVGETGSGLSRVVGRLDAREGHRQDSEQRRSETRQDEGQRAVPPREGNAVEQRAETGEDRKGVNDESNGMEHLRIFQTVLLLIEAGRGLSRSFQSPAGCGISKWKAGSWSSGVRSLPTRGSLLAAASKAARSLTDEGSTSKTESVFGSAQ